MNKGSITGQATCDLRGKLLQMRNRLYLARGSEAVDKSAAGGRLIRSGNDPRE